MLSQQSFPTYKKFYSTTMKTYKVAGVYLYPLCDVSTKQFTDLIRKIHRLPRLVVKVGAQKLTVSCIPKLRKLMESKILNRMVEYLDNRISRYSMKSGKCEITKQFCQQKPFTVITIYQKSWWRRQI